MTVWKIGIETKYCTYNGIKGRNVVAQGWSGTGDLSFLHRKPENLIKSFLQKLLPADEKGQTALQHLLGNIQDGDLVLAYEGTSIRGICEIPTDYIYKYDDPSNTCRYCHSNMSCEYGHSIFPVNWVDWNGFVSAFGTGTAPNPPGSGTRGVNGIQKLNPDDTAKLKEYWAKFKTSGRYSSPLHKLPPTNVTESLNSINCRLTKALASRLLDVITVSKQIILYGPPGTGKTYMAKALAARLLNLDPCDADSELDKKTTYWDIVQFHPSYTYEDFVGGIRPDLSGGSLGYTLTEGIFKKITADAYKNPEKVYVLIIDEINRANLPSVLGELLYALEYRGQPVEIPNFKEKLIVPGNLYIIGTMNNIDKSLVSFDVALQRRFSFEYLDADLDIVYSVLHQFYSGNPSALTHVTAYITCCESVSQSIQSELRLPQERPIGHSYFIRIKDYLKLLHKNASNQDDWIYCKRLLWDFHIAHLLEEHLGKRYRDNKTELDNIRKKFVNGE